MSSTCTQNWKNDVFLSFRGEDTRKTFVGHLYYALKQKGIHTFKDDERLERGKSISPELVKAIEESRFAIVVFSKNYASSTWCLDELGKIMECKKDFGQTVIPIFYDVDPSHVTKQSESFAKSFATHEENLKDDVEKVLCWRDAFRQAGKIAGYDLPKGYDGHESLCIQHVVEGILSKLCQVISTIENDLVGMESRMQEVSSLLRMETRDVCFIGIWGMGGIGKTTIASAVFGKYSGQFEGVCFLDNVVEMQRTRGLQYLQGVLLSKILKVSLTIASVYEGMRIIKERLRSMKVLIILDDVNQKDQLEMLVGGHDWFGIGSRILITTTDKHLLHNHVVDEVYSVNLMTRDEAIELFSLHAFKQRIPDKDFEELINQVVRNAGFLPLALKILGSSLYGLDKIEWKCTVDRLKDMPDHVLAKLKISFDGLSPSDQRLFLDIGCFYRGKLRSYVEEILESCDIGSTIRVLIEKSLLFVSPYDTIEMHDLIQEMAWHIVRLGDTRRSRIWLPEDIEDLFTGNLEAEAVEGLSIPRDYIRKQDISYYNINETFRKMKKLRVLEVRAANFCSIDPITHLPSSIRWLDWEGYPLNSLPQSFEPSKLLRLDILESSTLQKLWSISKSLDKLKTLYLSYCENLEEVPSFDMMPNLERVKLEGCNSLREVSPSFGVLMKLTSMELIDCPSLEKLPSCIEMGSLKSLKLSCLPKLRELPETKGMHRLLTLELTNCQYLEKIPNFDQMESLETLKLSCLPKVTTFPPPEGMHCVQDIVIEYVPIVELPASIGNLRSLKQLRLSHCKDLVSIPNSFCCLKNLRALLIYNCKRLIYLPEKIGDLKLLKKLVVSGTSISRIPPSVTDLGELNFLSFSRWSGYRQGATFLFPPASGVSSSLRVLKLNKNRLCSAEHFQDVGGLSSLAHLDLTRNDESTNQLFHYLDITFCEKLALPELPPCIKELYACDPLILKSIPDFLTKYSELYSVSFTRHIVNKGELTDMLLFVLRVISVASQCEKRPPFSLFFPGDIKWKWFTYYRKEQTKRFSTQLDPRWYESKFKGFVICFRVPSVIGQNLKPSDGKSQRGSSRRFGCTKVTAKLVQRHNRQEHDVLQKKCLIVAHQTFCSHGSKYAICFSYIPFVAPLWYRTSDNEKGKKLLNEYCFFEASIEPDIATKWGLLLVYENKIQQIDQSTIAVQHDVEFQNSHMFRECDDDQGQKMEDVSVKRRRLDLRQVMKDLCSTSIVPDQQMETPSSSAAQSFQHREESCSSGQPQTRQLPLTDPRVDEAIDEDTSCIVVEQPDVFEVSPDEHKDNSMTTGSGCSEVSQQLETQCTSGQSQTLRLFPDHS